jgi:WD40 repeat protein
MNPFRTLRTAIVLSLLTAAIPGTLASAQTPSPAIRDIPVESQAFHLRLSPDGGTAAVFEDGVLLNYEIAPELLAIRLIDLATGEEIASLEGFSDYAADAAFSPDGSRLVSKHLNGELLVWDLAGAVDVPTKSIQTTGIGVGQIAFLPDGQTLALLLAGIPSWLELVDVESGAVTSVMGPSPETYAELLEQTGSGPPFDLQLAAMAVSPDGASIATATFSEEVALWSIADGQSRTIRPPSEQPGRLGIRQLEFTPGGESLLWFDRSDGRTHGWDLAAGTESSLETGGMPFALYSDSAQLAWVERTDDGRASVGVVDLGGSVAPFSLAELDLRPAPGTTTIEYTPDGATIVVGGLFAPDGQNAIHLIPAPW